MTRLEIKRKYGISAEAFNFYLKMKRIIQVKKNDFEVDKKFKKLFLEKSTVYKYCFNDNYYEDFLDYLNFIKYTAKPRKLNKEEREKYEKELRKRDKKKNKVQILD